MYSPLRKRRSLIPSSSPSPGAAIKPHSAITPRVIVVRRLTALETCVNRVNEVCAVHFFLQQDADADQVRYCVCALDQALYSDHERYRLVPLAADPDRDRLSSLLSQARDLGGVLPMVFHLGDWSNAFRPNAAFILSSFCSKKSCTQARARKGLIALSSPGCAHERGRRGTTSSPAATCAATGRRRRWRRAPLGFRRRGTARLRTRCPWRARR